MSKILISYRREDSAHVTGRIYDRLVQQFGRTAVFKDVDSIPLGIDFRTYLDQQVAKCDVFLAVIGRNWMKPQGQKGKSRLADPADFVRLEIEAALKRQIPVIPVLVEGASIPPVDRLPPSLQGLSYRNGIVVRPDPDFHRDMDRLIEHLRAQIEGQQTHGPHPETPHPATDVSLTTTMTDPEVEPPEQEHIEPAVLPSMADAPQRVVEPVEEEPTASTPASKTSTDQSQSYLFGVIGLVVLIGAVAAFLILQPTSRPVEPIRYEPPRVVEKKEERPAQVIPPPTPARPSEPTGAPKKQEKPVEKRAVTSTPSIPSPHMIRVPPGSFMMGGSGKYDGTPTHEVQFTTPFAIAAYETTFDEYDRFAQATGRPLPEDKGWGRESRPVINVGWDDAKAYAQWLSRQTGKRYRLPTEAEWEYAARSGGQDQTWAGTSDESQLKDYAVYGAKRTEPVGKKQPNGLGLYDTSGNVWEWVEDCWHEDYTGALSDGSAWLETNGGKCGPRVIRGSSWSDTPVLVRASNRNWNGADGRYNNLGFRLAQDLP